VEYVDFSPATLVVAFLVGSVGFVLFVYGKRQERLPQLGVGLVLMVYPYFVREPLAQVSIAAALLGGLFLALRAGF